MNTYRSAMTLAAAVLLITVVPWAFSQEPDEFAEDQAEEHLLPSPDSLVPILEAVPNIEPLGTLMYFLTRSEMHKELKGEGPYTLFAPSDSAFAKLTKKQTEKLTHDRQYARKLLSRHIVKGRAVLFGESEELTVATLSGDSMTIIVTEDYVQVGEAIVLDEGIECTNGVIHVVDAVLLPVKGKQKD